MNDLCRSHARILHIKHFLNKFALIHHEAAAVPPERNLYAQIINAATEESAKLCGVFGETGSIDEGKSADMILLSASPLEDLRAFNTALLGVYMRGRYLGKREEAV